MKSVLVRLVMSNVYLGLALVKGYKIVCGTSMEVGGS